MDRLTKFGTFSVCAFSVRDKFRSAKIASTGPYVGCGGLGPGVKVWFGMREFVDRNKLALCSVQIWNEGVQGEASG